MDTDRQQAEAAFGEPEPPKRPPSRWNYLLAAALALAGIAGAGAWFVGGFTSLDGAVERLQRVPVPGERTVTLGEGAQAVYFESDDGENVRVPALRIHVFAVDGGAEVPLHGHGGSTRYSVSGYDGQSIAGFDTPARGRYRVSVSSPDAVLPATPVIALGEGVGSHIVWTIVGSLLILFGGLLAAGAWIVIVAKRRQRRRAPCRR